MHDRGVRQRHPLGRRSARCPARATAACPPCTGTTWARTILARPQIRSERTGFRLCGIADEPFWPLPNGSASSATSVRWPCRTSSATASQTWSRSARARSTHSAMPSRSTTWVATSAGRRPELGHDRLLDGRVDVGVGADRAGQLADGDRVPGPGQPQGAAAPGRTRSRRPGAPRRPARRGCRACGRPGGCPGAPGRARAAPRSARSHLAVSRSVASVSCRASAVSSRSDEVIPKWT